MTISRLDLHADDRIGTVLALQDAHFEINQLDFHDLWKDRRNRFAQRIVERADGATGFSHGVVDFIADFNLHSRFGDSALKGGLVPDHHAIADEFEVVLLPLEEAVQ